MPRHLGKSMIRAVIAAAVPFYCLPAQVATRPIGKVDVEYPEPFTAISGLRELRDGRVIVSDSRDKSLQLIDFERGTATPVGRAGAGPGEWGFPSRLYALPGDTTIMFDVANGRIFVINPDGKPGASIRLDESGLLFSSEVLGVDAAGRKLLAASRRPARPTDPSFGVDDVMRYDRRSGRLDTVATLAKPKGEQTAARMLPGGMMQMATNLPLAAQDLAGIAPDGRVAIVRAAPYRIEWIALDGRRTLGPIAAAPEIRVTDDEKEAFMRSQVRPGAILVRGPSGPAQPPKGQSTTPKLSSADFKAMMNPDMTWPAVKPPFLAAALHIARDGRVWVLRTRAHDDSIPVFDVFDGAGRVIERVALPKRTRLVGFGSGTVYLARTDEDDLVWLQRVARVAGR
jgi:hypothetical protein